MKLIAVAALAALSYSAAASAQQANSEVSLDELARADTESATQYADRYVYNANECGMESSRAIWSKNGRVLGYACFNNPNGH